MAPRHLDTKIRRDTILGIAIHRYIKTTNPVSSAFIAEEYPDEISSATIRNVLADLEKDGFLTHPHTSAGRVPTHKGYRYYVDHLMREIQLMESEKQRIHQAYLRQTRELELLLDKVSLAISDMMNYTGIVSIDGSDSQLICRGTGFVVNYPDVNDLQKISQILRALEEKESLLKLINKKLAKHIEVLIGSEIDNPGITDCSMVISEFRTQKGQRGRIAVLGPMRMNYERVVSTLDYLTRILATIE
jgi:transcriptional regulator of heat shock response